MSQSTQSFESHAKMVPVYHYFALPVLLITTIYFLYQAVTDFSVANLMTALFASAVTVAGLFARVFPLRAQDRVIRLEEALRMDRLLPDDLKGRIHEIRTEHIIGLRFASDDELPDLVRRVLDGEFENRKAVKAAVKQWRADHERL